MRDMRAIEENFIGCVLKSYNCMRSAMEEIDETFINNPMIKKVFVWIKRNIYEKKKEFVNICDLSSLFYVVDIEELVENANVLRFKSNILLLKKENARNVLAGIFNKASENIEKGADVYDVASVITGELVNVNSSSSTIRSLESVIASVNKGINDNSPPKLIPTGFASIDEVIGGLSKTNLLILAARTGMGKTSLCLNLALNICKNNIAGGIISLEMSYEQLICRLMSSSSEVPLTSISRGILGALELKKVEHASKELSSLKMYFDSETNPNVNAVISSARKMKQLYDIEFLIIDYLQLMTMASTPDLKNRQQEVSSISRALKLLAKDLNICIICLSQLSRKVEERPDKTPMMSDLRDSGAIEQDADQVVLLYRPDEGTDAYPKVIISKNRNGKTGSVYLGFKSETMQFHEIH